jgi:hypothetical protein
MGRSELGMLKGATAGMFGGVAGVLGMTAFQLLIDVLTGSAQSQAVRELSQRGGRHDIASLKSRARRSGRRQRDATVLAAGWLTQLALGRPLERQHRHAAGMAVHYAFGAAVGGAYGCVKEAFPVAPPSGGVSLGIAVWLVGEELTLPALGLTRPPSYYALPDHVNAFASHLLFGVTTDLVTARVRSWL